MALHCPALVIIIALAEDAAADDVEPQAVDLLSDENVAAVYSTDSRVVTETAARIARRLRLPPPTDVLPGTGVPQAIADAHRGETVLVVDRAPASGPNGRWVRTALRPTAASVRGAEPRGVGADVEAPILEVVRLEVGDEGTHLMPPGHPCP